VRQAPSVGGSLWSCVIGLSLNGHNRLSRLSARWLKSALISWLPCSVLRFFVFVGVDSNHFRYVLDFEVTVQVLVGDVPGGTADHSEHFWTGIFGGSWRWMACCIPIALSPMSRRVAVLPCIRLVCCLGIAVSVRLLAGLCDFIFEAKIEHSLRTVIQTERQDEANSCFPGLFGGRDYKTPKMI